MSTASLVRLVVLADDYAGYETRNLLAQHGLSIYIEIMDENSKIRKILFDTGQYGEAIIHNANLLGINLSEIDSIVLSHNHYDHTGGLLSILKYIKKRIPVIAHPDIFKPSIYISENNIRLNIGLPHTRREYEEQGAYFILVKNPIEIAPGVYFLGEINRYYPELAPVLESNYTIENYELVKHKLLDDTGLAIKTEKGVIVIGGCSHSGIVNIVEHASRITGSKPYSVIGGFHLLSMDREKIETIVEKLYSMGVEEVHAGHCTGFLGELLLMNTFGEKFKKIHVGYSITYP